MIRHLWLVPVVTLLSLSFALPVTGTTISQPQLRVAAPPGLVLSPSSGKPGTSVSVQGSGFNCASSKAMVVATFNGTALNGSGSPISCDGSFNLSFRVPDLKPGQYPVVAKGFAPPAV